MPRKKKVEVAPEAEVNTKEVKATEEPTKMKIHEFMDFVKGGATTDEIKKFIKDNHLIWRYYVPYNEVYQTAATIIDDVCFDVKRDPNTGDVVFSEWKGIDYPLINMHAKVHSFTMYMDFDYENVNFGSFYDFLLENNLNKLVVDLIGEYHGTSYTYSLDSYIDLDEVVGDIIEGIKFNREYANQDNIERIADSLSSIADSFRDGADAIVSIIGALNEGITGAATSPEILDTISSEIVNRMKEVK